MKKSQLVLMTMLTFVILLLCGCTNRTRISKILADPDSFLNKEITVAGVVTKAYKVNLDIDKTAVYQLDDGSGQIWVITHNSIPNEGSQVGLKGTVTDKIDLFGLTVAVVIKEQQRRTRE